MKKKNLLLVVGAGASVDFGMPSVDQVRIILNAEAQKWYSLVHTPATNLYEHIEEAVKQRSGHAPNFEQALYLIFALSAAKSAQIYNWAQGVFTNVEELPDFFFGRGGGQHADANALRQLGCMLVDELLLKFRELCRVAEQDRGAEIAKLKSFLEALHAEFEIAVVTLNYDNVMYRAFPGIETGFDPESGEFQQERIFNRQSWPCMLHLHGSVHFDMHIQNLELHEIHWQRDISSTFQQNSFGRSGQRSIEGLDFPTSVIVAGYGKSFQLLRRPFRTYYSELDRLVTNCDAVLFAGYGFGDKHLNTAFEGYRDLRRRPVVIIKFAADNEMTVAGSWHEDPSIHTILRTFGTHQSSMRWLSYSHLSSVAKLKEAKEFETSCDPMTPLAFWYDGMRSACHNVDKVLAQLK